MEQTGRSTVALSPADSRARWTPVRITLPSGDALTVRDDHSSDRIRCDHPETADGEALGRALLEAAVRRGRGLVLVLARAPLRRGLENAGFRCDAVMPGFYRGREDCIVATHTIDAERAVPGNGESAVRLERLLQERAKDKHRRGNRREPVTTEIAQQDDADAIATLVAASFRFYPTPSGEPDYVGKQITDGTPFRVVRQEGKVVASACADLVPSALSAELTDCATAPAFRGLGYMQRILADLMDDLRRREYATAFTLARVKAIGMNLAFARLGFGYRGRTFQSCRIGDGLEDINVWSTTLSSRPDVSRGGRASG